MSRKCSRREALGLGALFAAAAVPGVERALQVATINGAYASYEEHVKGSIAPRKYADFVVLEKDPRTVDPFALKDVRVVRTVMGGRTTHLLG